MKTINMKKSRIETCRMIATEIYDAHWDEDGNDLLRAASGRIVITQDGNVEFDPDGYHREDDYYLVLHDTSTGYDCFGGDIDPSDRDGCIEGLAEMFACDWLHDAEKYNTQGVDSTNEFGQKVECNLVFPAN